MAVSTIVDLARMSTATTGTGTITLASNVAGYLTFAQAGVSDGQTVSYGIIDGTSSEAGTGLYTSSGTTLTRNVIVSTNSNSAINLSGNAQVYVTALATDLAPWDNAGGKLTKTAGIQISGTNTNDSASSGYKGEYVSATVAVASAVSLTTTTAANVTSISLTAGDWDVRGVASFNQSGVTGTDVIGAISKTSATLPNQSDDTQSLSAVQVPFTAGTNDNSLALAASRISLSGTTNVYLIAEARFSAGTVKGYGFISARRMR